MFNSAVLYTPLHQWKLDGNTNDTGSTPLALAPAFTYYSVNGSTYGGRTSTTYEPFGNGIKLPMANDFTLTMILNPLPNDGYATLFSTKQSVINSVGSIMFYNRKIYLAYLTSPSTITVTDNVDNRITIRRSGNTITTFINGNLAASVTTTEILLPWEGFGDIEGVGKFSAPNMMRNIAYFDRALSDLELAKFLGS
jgi:hypothetical protein